MKENIRKDYIKFTRLHSQLSTRLCTLQWYYCFNESLIVGVLTSHDLYCTRISIHKLALTLFRLPQEQHKNYYSNGCTNRTESDSLQHRETKSLTFTRLHYLDVTEVSKAHCMCLFTFRVLYCLLVCLQSKRQWRSTPCTTAVRPTVPFIGWCVNFKHIQCG